MGGFLIKYLFIIIVLLTASCVNRGETQTGNLAVYTDEGRIVMDTAIAFLDGDSVLDILKKATRDARIQMEYTGFGMTAYVKGIDNLYEFDKGSESGWLFYVNDELIMQSAGSYKPKAGDEIVWQYVTEP
jgi:hypothetical protein